MIQWFKHLLLLQRTGFHFRIHIQNPHGCSHAAVSLVLRDPSPPYDLLRYQTLTTYRQTLIHIKFKKKKISKRERKGKRASVVV